MNHSLPFPSDASQEVRIPVESLKPVVEKLLTKSSMFQFDATVAADRIIEADLFGIPAHGCYQLPRYLEAIDMGDVDPRGRVLTTLDKPAFALLDGSRSLGHVAATKASQLAIEKARECGLGAVAVGNSQTLGAAEVYVRLMAQAGMIGLCFTSTGGATVAAPGTRSGAVGNCAFTYAVPTGASPLVFDCSCGEESWAKLHLLRTYGLPLPEDLLWDTNGQPTGDLEEGKVMPPRGGALGFGISLFCSVLAGPLAGGWMPIHKKRRVDAEDSQHFFLAIDPVPFCDFEKFRKELDSTLDEIRGLPPVDANEPVRVPGDRSAQCFEANSRDGVPLHQSVAAQLKELATKKKIDVPW